MIPRVPLVRLRAVAELPPVGHPRWAEQLSATELAFCAGLAMAGDHLAARLAGKEAVRAVLGLPPMIWTAHGPLSAGPPPGHDVEIRRVPGSAPEVLLDGAAEHWRLTRGLPRPGVSLSHAAGYAAALAWLPVP